MFFKCQNEAFFKKQHHPKIISLGSVSVFDFAITIN